MSEILEAVVIGAGSAGLGASYFLRQKGVSHAVIERGRIGETWRTQRWDSFLLNSSNRRSKLPGDTYDGSDPWGASTQHELIGYMEEYARRNSLPVTTGNPVRRLVQADGSYLLETERGPLRARNVVVATGNLNRPIRPAWYAELPQAIRQIDCVEYRNPAGLGGGAILVVGSGQSGGQIAEELGQAGRSVFLATSRTGRLVRNYRRGDTFEWLAISGFLDVPRKDILRASGKPPPRALHGATHTISLQSLSAQGVVLLGRFQGIDGRHLVFVTRSLKTCGSPTRPLPT
jgi:putative flavoprotein involved in K+ transport